MYHKIRCPMLIIHGDNDQISPHEAAKRVAEVTGAELVTIPDGGHNPLGRIPAKCNALINDFLDRKLGIPAPGRVKKSRKAKKALYLSSPSVSDMAAATSQLPESYASSIPTCRLTGWRKTPLHACSAHVGSASILFSGRLASETRHIEMESGEHELHCFQAIRRMDEVLIKNFMVFQDAVERKNYDLVIADEAWDIDHYWHEHPELKKAKLAWFTDFVGYVPMPSGAITRLS